MGFKDESECPRLGELVQEYLRRSKGCDNTIFEYFANEEDAESLYIKLENELERCILAYFAFHWSKASVFISQVCIDLWVLISIFFLNRENQEARNYKKIFDKPQAN